MLACLHDKHCLYGSQIHLGATPILTVQAITALQVACTPCPAQSLHITTPARRCQRRCQRPARRRRRKRTKTKTKTSRTKKRSMTALSFYVERYCIAETGTGSQDVISHIHVNRVHKNRNTDKQKQLR